MVEREMAEWYRGRISSSVLDDGVAVAVPSVTVEELRVEEDLEVTCEWIGAAGAGKGTGGPAEVLYDFVDFLIYDLGRKRGNGVIWKVNRLVKLSWLKPIAQQVWVWSGGWHFRQRDLTTTMKSRRSVLRQVVCREVFEMS